ncbi:MAG: hypothetical protein MRY74_04630, partial [Neomegalonema sp.]|nr:hypothetical protein [Neomegalonema sp.]
GAPAAEGGWLDQLLGRAAAPDPDRAARLAAASAHLDDAVAGLRAAGQEFMLVHGLLARAAFLRARCAEGGATAQADRAAATTDLDEAQEIADYGGMGLFKADIALERARWAVMDQDKAAARPHLEAARAQIESCGYGRLTPELEALEQATR